MNLTERRNCPACSSEQSKGIGEKNNYEILTCLECRTVFTASLPASDEVQDYDEYYSEVNLSVPTHITKRVSEIVGGFSQFRKNGRFLDIGFGAGTILEAAAAQDWDVFGLEVSKPAVDQARARGFKVFHGALSDAEYSGGFFDVVTASEILEHLESPDEVLKEIARIIRPGGLFWATTPSATGISSRLLGTNWSVLTPPEHMQLYSSRGIIRMLQRAGFKSVNVKAHGTNPMEIVNHSHGNGNATQPFDRVQSSYALNEGMTKSPLRRRLRESINYTLSVSGLGDSLKIFARK